MANRPRIIAVDDELESIESLVSGDPRDAISEARSSLQGFEAREAASQASLLDDAEASLLRAQEQVTGDRKRRLEAIRNRIRIYRETVSQMDEDLAVIDATIRTETEEEATVTAAHGDAAELVATVVNSGRDRRVTVVVAFYDETGDELEEFTTDELAFDANEQTPVSIELVVPEEASYFAVTALDAETQTIG